jgi:exonuclease SbcD
MRVLHTADWHVGKTLHGYDRLDEIQAALDQVLAAAEEHRVDLILAAGDIFDVRNPSAEAAETVNAFLKRSHDMGLRGVAIAGNHDSPSRLDALKPLATTHGTHIVGRPRAPNDGGCFTLPLGKEVVNVACVPFISHRTLQSSEGLIRTTAGAGTGTYQDSLRKMMQLIARPFRPNDVNILLMHGTLEGATLSGSEFAFHSTNAYTINPSHFPQHTTYAALGHIHNAQSVSGLPDDQARYSGSLIPLDFGEARDTKSVYVMDLQAGLPPRTLARIDLSGGKSLKTLRLPYDELEAGAFEAREFDGLLKVVVEAARGVPGLRERARQLIPNALVIDVDTPEAQAVSSIVNPNTVSLEDAYRTYVTESTGEPPSDELMAAFRAVLQDTTTSGEE